MKLKQLKKILNALPTKMDECRIVLPHDAEWNGFSGVDGVIKDYFINKDVPIDYELELFDKEEIATLIENEEAESIKDFEQVIIITP